MNADSYSGHSLGVFDLYAAPLCLLCLGVVFVVLAVTSSIPKTSDLSEVRGHLESYYFKQSGRGRDDYTTILTLEEGFRFWTDSLNKETAADILKERGTEIRSYVESNSTAVPINGAVKSYGLWVSNQEIESLDVALGHEKFIVRFCFPAVAVFAFSVACLIYGRNRANYARSRRTTTTNPLDGARIRSRSSISD
jgi:hypothetical protein